MLSIELRLKRFPPIVCRLLARTGSGPGTRPLTDEEIAEASGLTVDEIRSLSWAASWDAVPCGWMVRFTKACGVDLSCRRTLDKYGTYIKERPRWDYLRRDKEYEARWKPMLAARADFVRRQHG